MLKSSRNLRTLLFGAIIALLVGLVGPTNSAVAAPPVTITASITGTPAVGQTLTAVADVNPNNADLTYKWETTDSPTSLGTSSTFVPTSDLVGKQLLVTISGTANNRDPGSDTSDPSSAVLDVFTAAPVVEIDDTTPVVDDEITASVTTPSTPAADSYTFQWFAGANPIANATSASYTPASTDVGKTLTAKATAIKSGFLDTTGSSAATSQVAKADFTSPPVVTISGTPQVDQVLTANASGEVPGGSGYTYQWLADSAEISGAKSVTFTPGPDQVGQKISVAATATKAGYNPATGTSTETAPVALGVFSVRPTVILSFTNPKVGDTLTALPSSEQPAADSYAYQWYRISATGVKSAMDGETNDTYTVTPGNLNYKLQVKVTAIRAGYDSISASSVQTDRVNQITLTKTTVARGGTIGVTAKHLRSGQVYRIFIDGVTVYKGTVPSTGTVSRTVTVPKTIAVGTKKIWVSGYNSAGDRDFLVMTTVNIT